MAPSTSRPRRCAWPAISSAGANVPRRLRLMPSKLLTKAGRGARQGGDPRPKVYVARGSHGLLTAVRGSGLTEIVERAGADQRRRKARPNAAVSLSPIARPDRRLAARHRHRAEAREFIACSMASRPETRARRSARGCERLALRSGRRTNGSASGAADHGTEQRVEARHDAEQRARAGADAAAGHGALAPRVTAGSDAEQQAGKNDVLGEVVNMGWAPEGRLRRCTATPRASSGCGRKT